MKRNIPQLLNLLNNEVNISSISNYSLVMFLCDFFEKKIVIDNFAQNKDKLKKSVYLCRAFFDKRITIHDLTEYRVLIMREARANPMNESLFISLTYILYGEEFSDDPIDNSPIEILGTFIPTLYSVNYDLGDFFIKYFIENFSN